MLTLRAASRSGTSRYRVAGANGLSGVDPAKGSVDPELTTRDGDLAGVAIGFGSVWAIDSTGSLLRFDPSSTSEPVEIPLPSGPTDVTTTLSAVWVALRDGSVVRVNGANEVEATIEVGKDPIALAADQPLVWVADRDGDAVLSIDTQTNAAQKAVEVESPIDVAVTEEATWVLSEGGEVEAIDRLSGLTDQAASFNAPGATAIETGFGSIWLADQGNGELERFDPSGAQDWAPIRIRGAVDVATGTDSIWVGTGEEARVVKVRPSS